MNDTIKALTIHHPWASLIAVGAKKYETRSWATKYRGQIAIHAGKKLFTPSKNMNKSILDAWKRMAFILGEGEPWRESPLFVSSELIALYRDQFPLGAVIATAELVGCWKIREEWSREIYLDKGTETHGIMSMFHPSEQELLFGDWTPGRYAWQLANVKMLPEPIPARGQHGLWDWRTTE